MADTKCRPAERCARNLRAFLDVDCVTSPQKGELLAEGDPSSKMHCIALLKEDAISFTEIRRILYLNKRETPVDDQDPWSTRCLQRSDHWVASCSKKRRGQRLEREIVSYPPGVSLVSATLI